MKVGRLGVSDPRRLSVRREPRRTLLRSWTPNAIGHLRNLPRIVQPTQVGSDRVELLFGDLYAFSVGQLKPLRDPRAQSC